MVVDTVTIFTVTLKKNIYFLKGWGQASNFEIRWIEYSSIHEIFDALPEAKPYSVGHFCTVILNFDVNYVTKIRQNFWKGDHV